MYTSDYPCPALELTAETNIEFNGIFFIHGSVNKRPVYKHALKNLFLSYYKEQANLGEQTTDDLIL